MNRRPTTLLVCGGRNFTPTPEDYAVLASWLRPGMRLVHGDARGVDRWAAEFAKGLRVEVVAYPADWKAHGKAAGPIRNRRMLTEGKPDAVLAFPGGAGTADMVRQARAAGVHVALARLHQEEGR